MPLSEDEQRILRQIEQELRRDPDFSRRGYRVSRRRLLLLALGLLAGIALTIFALTINFVVAFVAFVAVLVVAVLLEREVRIIGREKLGTLPVSAWLGAGHRPRARRDSGED